MIKILKNYNPLLTQEFSSNHNGIDIVGNGNIPSLDTVISAQDGIVEEIETNCKYTYNTFEEAYSVWGHSYGCYITINHGMINGHTYKTRYAHLEYQSIKVSKGDKILEGQELGYMGSTGHTHGAHLHFEIIEDNIPINPYEYVFGNKDLKNEEESVNNIPSKKKSVFYYIIKIFSKIIARLKKLYTTYIQKSK